MMLKQIGPQTDAATMMLYDVHKKSTGIAYLLFAFFGMLGIHRFYLGQKDIGIVMLLCTLLGFIVFVPLLISLAICIYDLFKIPSIVSQHNEKLVAELTAKNAPETLAAQPG